MTRGEWDGNSTNDDLLDFFRQLPNGDRQYVDPAEHGAQRKASARIVSSCGMR